MTPVIPLVVRYALQHSEGGYLADGDPKLLTFVSRPDDARIFYSRRSAEKFAEFHNLEVVPLETENIFVRQRLVLPPRKENQTSLEILMRCVVEHCDNAIFVGIQKSFTVNGQTTPTLVLFNSRKTGTTLAMTLHELSSTAVKQIVEKSDEKFGTEDDN